MGATLGMAAASIEEMSNATVALRLLVALVVGAAIGIEREEHHKTAGLRTHVLITVSSAAFAMLGLELDPDHHGSASRVIQGAIAGVGFLGAGAILRIREAHEVRGLTTASGIWIATASGLAIGIGHWFLGVSTALLTLAVIVGLGWFERRFLGSKHEP